LLNEPKKLEIKWIISLYALVFNIIRLPNLIAFNDEFTKLSIYQEKKNIRVENSDVWMCVTLADGTAKIYFY
jgi:hypothetical protein